MGLLRLSMGAATQPRRTPHRPRGGKPRPKPRPHQATPPVLTTPFFARPLLTTPLKADHALCFLAPPLPLPTRSPAPRSGALSPLATVAATPPYWLARRRGRAAHAHLSQRPSLLPPPPLRRPLPSAPHRRAGGAASARPGPAPPCPWRAGHRRTAPGGGAERPRAWAWPGRLGPARR